MKNKKTIHISSICILLLLVVATLIILFQGNVKQNPSTTIGNSAGNLNNKGTFCEADGKVYFANPYAKNTLYVMNSDETNLKKLSNSQVEYLNVGGNYLYYFQTNSTASEGLGFIQRVNGIYRAKLNGTKTTCLDADLSGIVTLIGNSLFYQHYDDKSGMRLYRIDTDKTDRLELAPFVINPASTQDGSIYFNGTQRDHSLYRLDTQSNVISKVWECDIWNPIIQGDYLYYMDVPNNYRLCRYSFSENIIEVLTDDRIDCFNVYQNYIYYQKNSTTEPALKRILTDGSGEEVIRMGNHEKVNITSNYVYFNEFNKETPIYKTSTLGSVNVTTFEAASDAAFKNQ